MNGLSRETRLQIMLDENELTAIDNWRFKRRMPSRAAAIRELLRRGLNAALGAETDPYRRSGDFGVIDKDTDERI
jgi:metal-responsive CopG/Arc/MetJ family transcriptional regulator